MYRPQIPEILCAIRLLRVNNRTFSWYPIQKLASCCVESLCLIKVSGFDKDVLNG